MNKLAITLALAVFGTLAAVAIIGAPKSSTLADSDLQSLYSQWKVQYNQVYGGPEDKMRYHVFASNYHIVEAHNAQNTTWTLGMNQFAALTHDEFSAIYLGYKGAAPAAPTTNDDNTYTATGASVDWRTKGAVNPVKNQGQCGSCWAFSTVASVESAIFIATGKLPDLSEQQLVDCSDAQGNQGCNGGLPDQGFEYVQKTGLAGEDAYPYTATDGKCKEKTQKILAKISGYKDVAANVNAIKTAVTQQPVSIAIEADQSAFQLYNGGVISAGCGTELDHAVQIVGFAEPGSAGFQADAKDTPYWIVRNSWGASWGEQGYVRIAMGTQNNGAGECGINQQVSYPVV